jgi:catalase
MGTEPAIDKKLAPQPENDKTTQLAAHTADAAGEQMNTNTGLPINDDQNSLKAGDRGPTLL